MGLVNHLLSKNSTRRPDPVANSYISNEQISHSYPKKHIKLQEILYQCTLHYYVHVALLCVYTLLHRDRDWVTTSTINHFWVHTRIILLFA